MFNRVEFKEKAKIVLKGNYWTCFLATLLTSLITGVGDGVSNKIEVQLDNAANMSFETNSAIVDTLASVANVLFVLLPYIIIVIVLGVVLNLFVRNMLEIGQAKFFLAAKDGEYVIENLLVPFKNGSLTNQVITMFMRDLQIALWTLLFVIPGIIKSLEYRFVPYILAENPDMHYSEVLKLSSQMTNGIKLDLFILDWSFFGWHLLNLVTMGVASLFIAPYIEATEAEVYAEYALVRSSSEYYETY